MKKLFVLVLFLSFFFSCCNSNSDEPTETNITHEIGFEWKGSLDSSPKNPQKGWAYYDTVKFASYYWDGSTWQLIAKDGIGIIWKGELSKAPTKPQTNWAYYNRIDGNSYIWNGASWDFLAKSGKDGASTVFFWMGSYAEAPQNPNEGWAYYNTAEGISYIYTNDSWQIISKDGTNGKDGSSIVWKGALSQAPSFPETNWAYFNTVNQTSYIWDGSSWNILAISATGDTTVTVSLTWLGTFESAPANPTLGQAYYNSSIGASYIYDGSVWQQISKDGKDGIDGQDGMAGTSTTITGYLITWKGIYSSIPSNPQTGWAYYNTATKKSYVYDGTSWQIMSQDGEDGSDGKDGANGIGIVWKGSFASAPENPEVNWAYYNTTAKKSYVYDGLSW